MPSSLPLASASAGPAWPGLAHMGAQRRGAARHHLPPLSGGSGSDCRSQCYPPPACVMLVLVSYEGRHNDLHHPWRMVVGTQARLQGRYRADVLLAPFERQVAKILEPAPLLTHFFKLPRHAGGTWSGGCSATTRTQVVAQTPPPLPAPVPQPSPPPLAPEATRDAILFLAHSLCRLQTSSPTRVDCVRALSSNSTTAAARPPAYSSPTRRQQRSRLHRGLLIAACC